MAIINGRRILVPPTGITGQDLLQQVNPGPGRRTVIQQGQAFRPVQRKINGFTIITVVDILFLEQSDYHQQNVAFLQIRKDFIHQALAELTSRHDVDTIIDAHTHPFTRTHVSFSATDDGDERRFFRFLKETFADLHYASIVFSQSRYSARVWTLGNGSIVAKRALLKTQTSPEHIGSAGWQTDTNEHDETTALTDVEGFFHRSTLALGLDVMRTILHDQVISIIGAGGLGSVVAEHLIHMGFQEINLIDPDVLELSNLNRVVGAYYEDAQQKRSKVEVIRRHLTRINPQATIQAWKSDVYDEEIESVLALSDWMIMATDNHSSRLRAQELSVRYFVPLLSVGVNITVKDHKIEDMSGEVITARVGDYLCLHCLRRINPIRVASERHPDQAIREALVKRGYVTGQDVKEPAVKTLNTIVATIAVEVLINQYTEARRHVPVLVYENNGSMSVYEDRESVQQRNRHCFLCHI